MACCGVVWCGVWWCVVAYCDALLVLEMVFYWYFNCGAVIPLLVPPLFYFLFVSQCGVVGCLGVWWCVVR